MNIIVSEKLTMKALLAGDVCETEAGYVMCIKPSSDSNNTVDVFDFQQNMVLYYTDDTPVDKIVNARLLITDA